ncbi:MAG: translation initiation factor [Planctomycetota bacterium]|jgi:translation initiation factor 1
MSGLFAGTPLERPVTCEVCERPLDECTCPRDADGRVCRPADQTATVRLEKRKRGKLVTAVSGLDPSASDLESLGTRLRSACGAGGTVREGVVEIQGDHRDAVVQALRGLGYRVRG